MSESRLFNFYGTLTLVLVVIVLKGSNGEGQTSLFSNVLKKYIEETSASILNVSQSQNQLADTNSLMALGDQNLGQGGGQNDIDPSTVQESSFLAYNPASTDYIDIGFKRNQIVEYTVQTGDLLSFIASDYGVSTNSIIWANNLNDADSIKPGQILRIPPVSGVIHKIKSGDSINSLAKKYGVPEDKILSFNGVSEGDGLEIGEEIIVPDGKINGSSSVVATTAKRFSYLPDLGNYFLIPAVGFNWGRIHGRNGVDVANSCGTSIYASAEGSAVTVDDTGWNGGFGKFIKLIHSNGTETIYAHASKLLITAGQTVSKGQLIALMGTTGRSTGCHLHFEVHGAKNPLVK